MASELTTLTGSLFPKEPALSEQSEPAHQTLSVAFRWLRLLLPFSELLVPIEFMYRCVENGRPSPYAHFENQAAIKHGSDS